MNEVSLQEPSVRKPTLLDCFCGMGGVSDGFALEGFDVMAIDIVDAQNLLGYKHRFIQADIMLLNGKDFHGYDVIWGSPPCRHFTQLGQVYGKFWKEPPNPNKGLELINRFLVFAQLEAKPKIWIMENVAYSRKYIPLKPKAILKLQRAKTHYFWGNFPAFLMPRTNSVIRGKTSTGRDSPIWKDRKRASWLSARISLACSQAFARACKESLLEQNKLAGN